MGGLAEIAFDFIVVGSGPSGAMCAQTLVEAGRKVLMIDAGITPTHDSAIPNKSFEEIRKTEVEQYKIFLGEGFESLAFNAITAGSQLTPQKKYVIDTRQLLPFFSESFLPVESLCRGGLGEAWGLGCQAFSTTELKKIGLNVPEIKNAYQVVADRIGISYTKNETEPYTMPGIENLLPGINIDENASALLAKYQATRKKIQKQDFVLGPPSLALLTREKDGRSATGYTDMDFYGDPGQSAYRPSITIKQLIKDPNFVYQPGILVLRFSELNNRVEVTAIQIETNEEINFSTKRLMLATNVLSTARIVLRSLNQYEKNIPLLSNPYTYISGLLWKRIGKLNSHRKTSTVQLSLFHDPNQQNDDVAMASIYSYESLLLFRILKELPVGFKDALQVMRLLMPSIVIAGIHHPDENTSMKYLSLKKSQNTHTGDILQASYQLSEEEKMKIEKRERKFCSIFRQLDCIPLKKITPMHGASIHYAGVLPFNENNDPLTLHPSGRLSTTQNIFVADGSGFKYLPAKGITFSLMANAHRIALNALGNE